MEPEAPERRRIVVDGSNIATEGRTLPSLAQLDEAIRTFLEEYQGFVSSDVTVVVDASFGHRIDPSEVPAFEQAVEHGEMITPPAGAVGRGDGFILRIAEKSGALVLSNDSFQEFHAERPWLFEPGRLIGGKPVPGVGWIFTPRTPVRGARSRSVTSKSRRDAMGVNGEAPESGVDDDVLVPAGAAARGRGGRGGRRAKGGGSNRAVVTGPDELESPTGAADGASARATTSTQATKAAKSTKSTKSSGVAKVTKSTQGAATKAAPAKAATKAASFKAAAKAATKAATGTSRASKATATKAAKAAKTTKATKTTATKATKATKAAKATATKATGVGRPSPTGGTAPESADGGRQGGSQEALNDPMTFLTFVADHPVGSVFDGTVVSFTSHGAHIDVDGMLCHVPLRGMGDPPPNKARQVLTKGETRPFRLVSLDGGRRRAELALPDLA
jgi:hypothetical protein